MNLIRSLMVLTLWVTLLGGSPTMAAEDAARLPALTTRLSLGYRAVSNDHYARRAASFSLLDSGPTAAIELKFLDPTHRFMLLGTYLNDSDYLVEADFDYRGLLRVNIESEKLIHNLDHFSYDRPDAANTEMSFFFVPIASDAGDDYYVKVGIDKVNMKAKLPDFPGHLTLDYWRLVRTGKMQLRYLNEDYPQFQLVSKTRDVDRVTEEFTMGLDTHLGYINLAVEQLFREFVEKESIPYDLFLGTAQSYQHDETPDSRLVSTTIKASTSPSGGVVAAAGFTVGKKENLSDLSSDVHPVESETDFYKGSTDLTLIPDPKLTVNFKYRILDQDNSTPSQMTVSSLDPAEIDVRQNIDITRATYHAKVSYRPTTRLTLMGEFERKEIHRGQTGAATDDPFDPFWELPEDENINRYRLSFIARPLGPSKLKINGWYEYRTSDDPAYGASVEEQQQIFAGVNWTPTPRFGATTNIRLSRGINCNFDRFHYDSDGNLFHHEIDRKQQQEDFTVGFWAQPTETLNVNFHYGFLRSDTSQDVIFGAAPNSYLNENADYRQRVHSTTFSAALRLVKNLQAMVEARHIRSHAVFNPDFAPQNLPVIGEFDSSGLSELSELEIVQSGIALGLEWTLSDGWSCSSRFSHDDYEDRNSSDFDGTAQLYMVSVSRNW
ncbi:MAG: hypothetical protein A2X84_09465 [Desulfuromonadaceae bacterium GWC2_58_13]|nr:MAG: hypothetical protein A2X84_09465 [Desulfuromonadaceae bacterium GWC2_58_13]